MMKTIKQKKLQKLEIELDDCGFTVWITENVDGADVRHWLVDGSNVKETGYINLGSMPQYKYHAIYDDDNKAVRLVKYKIKKTD